LVIRVSVAEGPNLANNLKGRTVVRKHFHKLALIVVLGSGFAIAQTMPSQQPSGSQSSTPQTQSPSSTDQQPSSTAPDKTLPNTDQTGQSSTNPSSTNPSSTQSDKPSTSGQSLPQSDASASATGNGDVQNNIQSAIQKDPSLANANVTVDVKNGKSVTLTGTVPSKDAKDAAERIAKENSNGMKVKNHLKVASNKTDTNSSNPKGDMSNPK
jgi:BON domain